jgi:hypothetical protein
MKKLLLPLMAVATFGLALGGCASSPATAQAANDDIDYAKVAAINRLAARSGLQVIWINLPQKQRSAPPSGS